MNMILSKCGKKEMMIDPKTKEIWHRDLSQEEQARVILQKNITAEEKFDRLQNIGMNLEEILKIAIEVGFEDDEIED